MDKRKIITIVKDTPWNGFLELNRMAFDDYLPRNSESHCIAATLRMIRREAPQIKWVVSFADATQCGDGTIYRASNFLLTQIQENRSTLFFPKTGDAVNKMTLQANWNTDIVKKQAAALGVEHRYRSCGEWRALGAYWLKGYMLRYLYILDKHYKKKIACPILPYSEIDKIGAGMYKGKNVTREERHEIKCDAQIKREEAK